MKKKEKFSMACEKCHTPTSSMVCLPKRRRADGTIICFWQVCLKCAKEMIRKNDKKEAENGNKRKHVRGMSEVQVNANAPRRLAKKPIQMRRVRGVVRVKECKEVLNEKEHIGKAKRKQAGRRRR